jgi:two-component system, OmpR family, sensor kinase
VNVLRTKLRSALLLLIVLIAVPSLFAWNSIQQIEVETQRSRLAHKVLEEHLSLAESGYELMSHLGDGGTISDQKGGQLSRSVDGHLTLIRKMIAGEIALIGEDGANEEEDEIERVDRISRSLRSAVNGNDDGIWTREINAAVAEERREVDEIDALLARATRSVTSILLVSTMLTFLFVISGLVWLQRSVVRPTVGLIDGMRHLAEGDLGHRLEVNGSGELRSLASDFNRMAAQVHASAKTMENDRNTLQEMVEDRTLKLRELNEDLKLAVDRRVQFLADISHELRTPLAIVRGEAEVTLRGEDKTSEEYRASLNRVVDQVNGMARLVDDLLYVARNESGSPKQDAKPVALKTLIERTVSSLRPLIAADNGRIAFNAHAEGSAQVIGDGDRLRQLITILLDNAMHYSEGPPIIDVTLMTATGGYAVIIRDRGIGIAEGELPHIFERYRRGSGANEQNGEGTGLGLPLAKAIIESHGGSISLESIEDEGTTVTLLFPAASGMKAVA